MSHVDPLHMADVAPTGQISSHSTSRAASPNTPLSTALPTLHLVDGDGTLVKSDSIVEFINAEVAGVQTMASAVPKFNRLSFTGTSTVGSESATTNFCHQYIRQVIGLRYHVVGVFGGQSSGKSTLLNAVFGTNFATMNADEGRHQTTKGAFMSVTTSQPGHLDSVPEATEDEEGNMPVPRPGRPTPPLKDPLLVVDFEGTDGAERGEDQSLERHLSLFALSIADTLIVNMWTTEVGRFNGANLSLLRTVFEVNLQLFNHDHNLDKERPTLLFVMRDSTNPAHFGKNCERVRASIDKIWETIQKPRLDESDTDPSIERFFNIRFFAFPHYELQRADFIEHVKKFRSLFLSSADGNTAKEGVFSSPSSFRGIPLEAVPQYLTSCWESILKSKDLDIPTQREMLSRFRCKDLVDEKVHSYKQFTSQICERMADRADITLGGKIRTVDGKTGGKHTLQSLLQAEFDRLVTEYNEDSKLYAPRVVSDHRDRLRAELLEAYNSTVKVQCSVVIKEVMRNLEGDVHELVDGIIKTRIWQNPAILRTAELPLGTADTAGRAEGTAAANAATDMSHEDVCVVVRSFWKSLCDGTRTMAKSISTAEDTVQRQLLGRCYGIVQADPALREMVGGQLNVAVATLIKKRLETTAADAAGAMHKTFEYVLNHHTDGSLKIFSTPEGLQKQFRPARFAGLVLAACLFYCRMEVKEHATNLDAMLAGDDSGVLESEGSDDADLEGNQALFAKTLSSMTNVSVRFAENEEEKDFYLAVGSARVAMDAIAESGIPSTQSNRTGGAVLSSSDKGVAVGYGVHYPHMPASLAGAATPRFINRKDVDVDEEEEEGDQVDATKGDGLAASHVKSDSEEVAGINLHNILISRSALRRALQLYHQQIHFTFQVQLTNVEAKAKGAHIPMGMWIALAYFAHDEIFYILRSPVLLIIAVLVAYFFFSAYIQAKWTEFEETGPPVVVAFIRQAIVMAKPYVEGITDQLKPLNEIGKEAVSPAATTETTEPRTETARRTSTSTNSMTAVSEPEDGVRRRKVTAGIKEE